MLNCWVGRTVSCTAWRGRPGTQPACLDVIPWGKRLGWQCRKRWWWNRTTTTWQQPGGPTSSSELLHRPEIYELQRSLWYWCTVWYRWTEQGRAQGKTGGLWVTMRQRCRPLSDAQWRCKLPCRSRFSGSVLNWTPCMTIHLVMFCDIFKQSPLNCVYKGQRHDSTDAVPPCLLHLLPNLTAYVSILLLVHIKSTVIPSQVRCGPEDG